MTTTRRSAEYISLALLLAATACGDSPDGSVGQPATGAAEASAEPWKRIPPDSLYGATALETLSLTPVVLDVVGLPQGWDGMTIAAISDLQLGLWEENEAVAAAAIRRAIAAEPDVIVLLGDYIAEGLDTEALARVLSPLRGRIALAVLGDRDVRADSVAAAISGVLRASGVTVLRNAAASVTRNGVTAGVVGLDPELVDDSWATQEYVLATTGGGETPLLIMHHPTLASRAPDGKYSAALAGNTFCGPVEVPGTPRLSWLQGEALPGAAVPGAERLFLLDTTVLFVTCGVGYSFVPTRLGGAPEVALVTLRSAEAARREETDTASAAADSLVESYAPRDTAS